MNKQEVFDKVWQYFIEERHSAGVTLGDTPETLQCAFRTDTGEKCAVGCLIPDKVYRKAMECRSIGYLLIYFPGFAALFDGNAMTSLLLDLQDYHDSTALATVDEPRAEFTSQYKAHLLGIAKSHNLTIPTHV